MGWRSLLLLLFLSGLGAQELSREDERLLEMGLEELMQVDVVVTTAARHPERAADAAAAASVITGELLRRSGVTSLPEALRLVPGVQVARVDRSSWAVSVRGFNDLFANKLLVLVDGRSVYTPLFSGVFWDIQDTFLPDLDRIEVIRGPGATLWGANAVNGVIQVFTKPARETLGEAVRLGFGTEERAFVGYRHGGRIGEHLYYRVFGKVFHRDAGRAPQGAHDDARQGRTGLRLDWEPDAEVRLTVQGEAYRGRHGQAITFQVPAPPFARTFIGDTEVDGGFGLLRLTRDFGRAGQMRAQLSYEFSERNVPGGFGERRHVADLDLQHRLEVGAGHRLTGGLGYRVTWDRIQNIPGLLFQPRRDLHELLQFFVRDDWELLTERLLGILGTRFEYNDFTGLEIQPTARMRWRPAAGHTLWAALSRAVRTPSRAEDSVRLSHPPAPGTLRFPRFLGSRRLGAEVTWAAEGGYRLRPRPNLALDLAVFLQRYRDLIIFRSGTPFSEPGLPPGGLVWPFTAVNGGRARTYGLEVAVEWEPRRGLRLQGNYALLRMHVRPQAGIEDQNPRHQASFWCRHDLGRGWTADAGLRYVDRLKALGVPAYLELDVRLAWAPRPGLLLELVGRNLLDPSHPEFRPDAILIQRTEVEREVFLGLQLFF